MRWAWASTVKFDFEKLEQASKSASCKIELQRAAGMGDITIKTPARNGMSSAALMCHLQLADCECDGMQVRIRVALHVVIYCD